MQPLRHHLAAAAILLLAAPAAAAPPKVAPILAEARDSASYARPAEARVTHVALDLAADFAARRLSGTATLDLQASPAAREIVLDSKGLAVRSVRDGAGRPLPFAFGASDPEKGAALTVRLNGARRIRIDYSSAADAEALQWLTPAQTAGKRHPFLFSQGQPTLNRSWIPTQDSPGIRQTWEARITVPEPLGAVMSGERLTPKGERAGPGRRAFRFRMDKPVAPYLIALAVGDLAFQRLGPRTGVYAEPATIRAAAAELVDTEKMVAAAERLYGPYRWGRYDMIVLPPAFPYGGMENPTLTFLTPTFIAGDRSLVGLVAHELSHSWSGNLVTNAVWADSWLNEGVTSYFENRIMEALYGPARASQEAALSWADMEAAFAELGRDAPGTRLHDPSDAEASGIVYDKGATFLRTLERTVGRQRFDAWLRSYFDRHAFEPMTSQRFLADLRATLVRGDRALEERLQLDRWVYAPGLPDNAARPDPAAFARVDAALAAFDAGGGAAAVPYAGWTTAERLRFLNGLPRTLPQPRLAELDRALGLTAGTNAETLFAWLQLALANRYAPAVPAAERFLLSQGRTKFVAPLFKTLLAQGEWGRPIAERLYAKARPGYHSVTTGRVDKLMKP
ncbi:MAG: M1 family metallopeptidase [Alphaproteobacteria bacterium]|nr:M1 family metallopeptidase [Alphaproteobacteria bacterium]MBV9373353.1 M1 family metallopeptidase [Alphaproteobacteria bacterium]MBV9902606.1 M1 family metallopeptidase [Alphaproteobacteria bacterium]